MKPSHSHIWRYSYYAMKVGGNKEYIARVNFSSYPFIDTWSFYEAPNRHREPSVAPRIESERVTKVFRNLRDPITGARAEFYSRLGELRGARNLLDLRAYQAWKIKIAARGGNEKLSRNRSRKIIRGARAACRKFKRVPRNLLKHDISDT